jgi:hypothetical protein
MTSLPRAFLERTGPWSGPVTLLIRPKPVVTNVPTIDALAVAPLAAPEEAFLVRPGDGVSMRDFGNAFGFMSVHAVDIAGLLEFPIPHTGDNLVEMLPAVRMRMLAGEGSLFHTTSLLDINVSDEQALATVKLHASALSLLRSQTSTAPILQQVLSRLTSVMASRGRIPVSPDTLSQLLSDLEHEVYDLNARLRTLAGESINPASPGQVASYFQRRGYTSPLRTEKGAPSWTEAAIARYFGPIPPEVTLVRDLRAAQNALTQAKKLRDAVRPSSEAVFPRWTLLSEKGHLSPSSSSPAFNFLSARVRSVFCRAESVWFGVRWPDTLGLLAWATGGTFDLTRPDGALAKAFAAIPEERRGAAIRAVALDYVSDPAIAEGPLGLPPTLVLEALQAGESRRGLLNEVLGLVPSERTTTSLGYTPPPSTSGVPPLVRLMECERSEQMYKLALSLFDTEAPIQSFAFSDHTLYLMVPQYAAEQFYARHINGSLALDGGSVVQVSVGRSPGIMRGLNEPGAFAAAGLL